eukprot:498494_1
MEGNIKAHFIDIDNCVFPERDIGIYFCIGFANRMDKSNYWRVPSNSTTDNRAFHGTPVTPMMEFHHKLCIATDNALRNKNKPRNNTEINMYCVRIIAVFLHRQSIVFW